MREAGIEMAQAATGGETESRGPDPQTSAAGIDLDWLSRKIPYVRYQECVHCGLCTASCPTYIETCNENDSPRGRIYLMRAVADGRLAMGPGVREHLELCLDCRACESACPSGVQYGRMIEPFKIALESSAAGAPATSLLQRMILHHLFPYPGRLKWALLPARLLQRVGLLGWAERVGLTRLLPPTLRRMAAMLPRLSAPGPLLPEVLPAVGPRRARVALFLGCIGEAMYPETNAATARVLQANGCEVVVPRGQVCCGAIHYHSGVEEPALELARRNLAVFAAAGVDAIIVNAAGCGADAQGLRPRDAGRVARGSQPVREQGQGRLRVPDGPGPDRSSRACAAQGRLPRRVPSLPWPADPQRAAGAAGDDTGARARAARRVRDLLWRGRDLQPDAARDVGASGPAEDGSHRGHRRRMVVTGNVGCILQIARKIKERGRPIEVAHPVDLLDRSYRGQ